MSVNVMTLYRVEPDFIEEALALSREITKANLELGAEQLVLSQIITGQYTGCWLATMRAPDMATIEKVLQALPDNEHFKVLVQSGKVTLISRNFANVAEGF